MKLVTPLAIVFALALPTTLSAQAFNAGSWDISQSSTGGPMGNKSNRSTICFTPAMLKSDPAAPIKPRPPTKDTRAPKCNNGPVKVAGGSLAYTANCTTPIGSAKVNWSGVHTPNSFTVMSQMSAGPYKLKTIVSGKYLGQCK
jgi:Protein of unknown function (DUF3617)